MPAMFSIACVLSLLIVFSLIGDSIAFSYRIQKIDGSKVREILSNEEILSESNRSNVASFKVMDVLARAQHLESTGKKVYHLEVGQPMSGAPTKVVSAATDALQADRIGYTHALGISPLRKRISQHYLENYGVEVNPERIIVTTGSSAGFLIAFLAAFDADDKVALASAGYPCYRNILNALGCKVATVDINGEYKVTASELSKYIENDESEAPLKGLILSSPSNPTGAMLTPEELKELCTYCKDKGIVFISDEIYHGISFGETEETALKFSNDCIVINSFSKYYSMTGWRLGWMVVPESLVDASNRLAQNFYINAPTLSQLAAVSAFDCGEELNDHVERYSENRKIILDALKTMGITKCAPSDGAFYVYADIGDFVENSEEFCYRLLEECGIAITPGTDFEDPASQTGKQRIRFSFCGSTEDVRQGMQTMESWWIQEIKNKQ